ncbi:MAG: 2-hydroxyacid dehydrogenase [Actinomycetes bacterium]
MSPAGWRVLLPPILTDLPLPAGVHRAIWDIEADPEARGIDLSGVEVYVPGFPGVALGCTVMARMPALRLVQTLTAGVDRIREHVPPGVVLANARGVHDASTAELAVTLMLAAQRGIDEDVRAQGRHEWRPVARPSLAGATVLIVGYGSIGQAIEQRLAGFEVEVVRVARHAREGVAGEHQLPGLLGRADVVVIAVPMTEGTVGMVDAAFLARLPDGALLVNVARGPVVRTDALLAEVSTGRLRAALDVTDPEPLPADHPLWDAPGVLITPHVGGNTTAMLPRARQLVAENLRRYAAGEPLLNVVTGEY